MTIPEFIASLPAAPERALAEIAGALEYDGIGHTMAPEDRQALVTRRAEIMRRAKK